MYQLKTFSHVGRVSPSVYTSDFQLVLKYIFKKNKLNPTLLLTLCYIASCYESYTHSIDYQLKSFQLCLIHWPTGNSTSACFHCQQLDKVSLSLYLNQLIFISTKTLQCKLLQNIYTRLVIRDKTNGIIKDKITS